MATWQYDLLVIPQSKVLDLGCDNIDQELYLQVRWWGMTDISSRVVAGRIDSILTRGVGWSESLLTWGVEDGTRIDLLVDGNTIEELKVRIDLRSLSKVFLYELLDLVVSLDAVFVSSDGTIIPPEMPTIAKSMFASDAARFTSDPSKFLENLLSIAEPNKLVPREESTEGNSMESLYDEQHFRKIDGDRVLFCEIEVDGTMLIFRSGVMGCKRSEVNESSRLFSCDAELVRAWKTQVEQWKTNGFAISKKKMKKSLSDTQDKNPGDTVAEIISAIEARLTPAQRKSFRLAPPKQIMQQQFDAIGFKMPSFIIELYSWYGGCYEFLPANDLNWEELYEDYSGCSWLTIDEAFAYRKGFLDAWSKKDYPFVYKNSWLMIFGDDSNGFAVDLSSDVANPLLIGIDHELGTRQTNLSLCDALRRVFYAIENDVWIPVNED